MPSGGRELAVFEAVKRRWLDRGLDQVVPNGVFWPDAAPTTPMPYCLFGSLAVATAGYSSQGKYRTYTMTFKVYATDQASACDLADAVAREMEDAPLLLSGPDDGQVFAVDSGPLRFDKEDEGVYWALAEVSARRHLPRTRGVG
jgi:hypothetical protein